MLKEPITKTETPFVLSEVEGRCRGAGMAFWTYMLRCADGHFYVGHSDNLELRMAQHQQGGFCDYTSKRRPVALTWSQDFATREEALAAERQIKGWVRAKKEALIRGDWARLSWLAKPPGERPSTSLRTNGIGECDPERREGNQG